MLNFGNFENLQFWKFCAFWQQWPRIKIGDNRLEGRRTRWIKYLEKENEKKGDEKFTTFNDFGATGVNYTAFLIQIQSLLSLNKISIS